MRASSLVKLPCTFFYTRMDDIALQAVTSLLSTQSYSVVIISKFYLTHISWRPLWARPWGLMSETGPCPLRAHCPRALLTKGSRPPCGKRCFARTLSSWRRAGVGTQGAEEKAFVGILWEWLGAAWGLRMATVWGTPQKPLPLEGGGVAVLRIACAVLGTARKCPKRVVFSRSSWWPHRMSMWTWFSLCLEQLCIHVGSSQETIEFLVSLGGMPQMRAHY